MARTPDPAAPNPPRKPGHQVVVERSPKRVRVMAEGKTVADSLDAALVLESGHMPVYYFPRHDVRMDLLERTSHRTHCPYKGDASYWSLKVGGRRIDNGVWSYEQPFDEVAAIRDRLAFYWDKVDHWFEEDEEIFGHPRDPHHRIDVRPSSRLVRVVFENETIALSRRGLFLFETGLPTRYYLPAADVRMELLIPSRTTSVCPYKGTASYFSLRAGERLAEDLAWCYREPLPDCPRIREHLCFYPEKVDLIEVEGEATAPAAGR